jgi:hypothetical protein
MKHRRLSSVYFKYLSRIPGHVTSWCQNNLQHFTLVSEVGFSEGRNIPSTFHNIFNLKDWNKIYPSRLDEWDECYCLYEHNLSYRGWNSEMAILRSFSGSSLNDTLFWWMPLLNIRSHTGRMLRGEGGCSKLSWGKSPPMSTQNSIYGFLENWNLEEEKSFNLGANQYGMDPWFICIYYLVLLENT